MVGLAWIRSAIGQPLALGARQGPNGALAVIDAELDPVVVRKSNSAR
jgi:hypothetical protein